MKRAYIRLLGLYPGGYRVLFAAEMADAFEEGLRHRRGFAEVACFLFGEAIGLARGAACAWFDRLQHRLHHRGTNCHCLPDFRMMRPPWTNAKTFYVLLKAPLRVR